MSCETRKTVAQPNRHPLGRIAVHKEEETLPNRCRNRLRRDLIDWKPDSSYQNSWIDSIPIWLPYAHPITAKTTVTATIFTDDPIGMFLRTPLSP
jgi:hypothetical protein